LSETQEFGFVICASCGARIRADRERCLRCHEPLVAWKRSEIPLPSWIHALGGGTLIFGLVGVFALGVLLYLSFESTPVESARPVQRTSTQSAASATAPVARGRAETATPIQPIAFVDTSRRSSMDIADADLADARKRFEEALEHNSKDADTQNNLGVVLERLGFVPSAIRHLSEAVALDRRNWAYHFNLAHAASLQLDWNRAASEYAAVTELFPSNSAAQYNLAFALHSSGNEAAAVTAFEKAIALAPGDPAPHLSLAVSLESVGRSSDAAAEYERYLQMVPGTRDAAAVKARIQSLSPETSPRD
jgi:tetratricopeptide (TPR) repeat protein/ribosomal protein L40E